MLCGDAGADGVRDKGFDGAAAQAFAAYQIAALGAIRSDVNASAATALDCRTLPRQRATAATDTVVERGAAEQTACRRACCIWSNHCMFRTLSGGDPDLAWRAGPQPGIHGLLEEVAFDRRNGGLEFIDAAVLDGLVAKGHALFALDQRRFRCVEVCLCVGHQRNTVRLISEESSNDADVVAQLMSTY